jgi:hypothetical protein
MIAATIAATFLWISSMAPYYLARLGLLRAPQQHAHMPSATLFQAVIFIGAGIGPAVNRGTLGELATACNGRRDNRL